MKVIDREWVSKAPKLRHVAPFDGIRGIGIFGVMIGHSYPLDTLSFAGIVDIFFVISGFLITSLLLQEHRTYGRIDLKKFYARRSLRLLPLLYVTLATVGVAGLVLKATGQLKGTEYTLSGLAKESVAAGLYVHNIFYPTLAGAWHAHLWTLSVEEQFYLVVGVFMVVGLRRGWIKPVTWFLIAAVATIQLSRLFGLAGPPGVLKDVSFAVWLQRPDSLMVGMLCAIANAHLADPLSEKTKRLLKLGGWIGVVGIFTAIWASSAFARNQLGIHIPFWPGDANYSTHPDTVVNHLLSQPGWFVHAGRIYWEQWGFTVCSWSFFLITLPAFRVPEWFPNKILSVKPLVLIGGMLSYGLYIWHYPVQHIERILIGTKQAACQAHNIVNFTNCRAGDTYRMTINPVLQLFLDCALPFVIAIPTYFLVEKKALEIKDRFQVDRAAKAAASMPAPDD
jgi:peptidoglycan/LPS O-acetylase OafA/YrhL